MKKALCAILLAVLVLATAVPMSLAEGMPAVLARGAVQEVKSGDSIDLDGDGVAEAIAYASSGPDEEEGQYTLTVGGSTVTGTGCGLTGRVHAMRLNSGMQEAYLLVSEFGPSDDSACYVYRYAEGKLAYAGLVGSAPEDIYVTGAQFTGSVRANVLETWYRPADFTIARAWGVDETTGAPLAEPVVVEVPRAVYPMGTIVTAKVAVSLAASQTDDKTVTTVQKGEKLILAGSDDLEWVYAVPVDAKGDMTAAGGWFQVKETQVVIHGKTYDGSDVFDGLVYAD
jgi:hypothetical protein